MMSRSAPVLALFLGLWVAGCAHKDAPTADPEATQLAPPVVIVDDPLPAAEPLPEPEPQSTELAPAAVAKDPNAEVITFADEDADPGMTDEITGAPKREPLPSMMSDVLTGPNK